MQTIETSGSDMERPAGLQVFRERHGNRKILRGKHFEYCFLSSDLPQGQSERGTTTRLYNNIPLPELQLFRKEFRNKNKKCL